MADLPELLCPAGSREAALAALSNGADALYLGAAAFGARAGAGFDREALDGVIRLCHLHGRRVHVTVNTLVKQGELPGLRDTLRMLCDLRADAVLVQDMGVLALIREEFPGLTVHASTQMAIHNAAGARFLQRLGVRRAVLARECGLPAIRQVAATGIETEVFVHGAQCVCVSGQCRYSGLIGGRSGNRGRCAQPCRLPYDWQGQTAAWLSPRDLCLRDHLAELTAAGVASLKIEGRLKRPEYVAVVTRAYRQALDALAEGRFAPADRPEREALGQVFSRTFFPGYAFGAQDAAVLRPERVSSEGVEMGRLTKIWKKGPVFLAEALLSKSLNDGDGLQIRGSGEQDAVYSGTPVPAGQTAVLRLHRPAKPGDAVIRIDDARQLAEAKETYTRRDALPPLPFDAELTAWPGMPARLTLRDDRTKVTVEGEAAAPAQSAPLDADRARRALEKTGDTPFVLRDLRLTGQGAFLPAAALNDLRRRGLSALAMARADSWPLPKTDWPALPAPAPQEPGGLLYAQCTDPALAAPLLRAGADRVIYAPLDITEPALSRALDALPPDTYVALPVQLTDDALAALKHAVLSRGLRLCAGSVGQLDGTPLLLSEGVPCWNARAAETLRCLGGVAAVLPRELSGAEIAALTDAAPESAFLLPVYGRARLMYLNHCPARTALQLREGRENCRLCEQGRGCRGQALTDRRGQAFPLLPLRMPEGCLVQLLSCQVRSLNDRAPRGLSWLLDFTLETAEEALQITGAYRTLLDGGNARVPGSLERWDTGVE